jgi:hypothetical protein
MAGISADTAGSQTTSPSAMPARTTADIRKCKDRQIRFIMTTLPQSLRRRNR